MPNSRWYSGGGIYRDVMLLTAGHTYIVPGTFQVTTESIDEGATLRLQATVRNSCARSHSLTATFTVKDDKGEFIESIPLSLPGNAEQTAETRIHLDGPQLWTADTPNLCNATVAIADVEGEIDTDTCTFGIRTVEARPTQGLLINGKVVKLRGACIHHDGGIIGAAAFYDNEYRRVSRLKAAGFNAVRISHNPASEVLLQACDELGMYVMDEAFDMWQKSKSNNDYSLWFEEWCERDVESMVRSAYNHPSVILYSVGNEIPEIATDYGARLEETLCATLRALDRTRPITAGINIPFALGEELGAVLADHANASDEADAEGGNVNDLMTAMDEHWDEIVLDSRVDPKIDLATSALDIAGYNYATARYELDASRNPQRIIVGSETYPPEIARNWELVERLPSLIGDFTWTGWDYIGEVGVGIPAYHCGEGGFGAQFPCQLAYVGDIDITGFRRPMSYYREIAFGLRTDPFICVQPPEHFGETPMLTPWVLSDAVASWNHPGYEGRPIVIEVYGAGDEVELIVNGEALGRKPVGEGHRLVTRFETIYQPGSVEAILYEKSAVKGRSRLESAQGEPILQAVAEEGNTGELVFVDISLEDEEGRVFTDRFDEVTADVEGALEWHLGSADPKPRHNYDDDITNLWHGRAQLIARRKPDRPPINIVIQAVDQSMTLKL